MLAVAMLAFGALVWGIFLLGRESFGWPVGALAAFTLATREPFLSQGMRAYVDIPFLALVVARGGARGAPAAPRGAGARPARPGRPAAPGGLAARGRLLALPAAGPAAATRGAARRPWSWPRRSSGRLSDLAITGNALHSLTFTRDTAETLGPAAGHRERAGGDAAPAG